MTSFYDANQISMEDRIQVRMAPGRAGKKARGSRAGSGSIRLGSVRLASLNEPEPSLIPWLATLTSRAGSVRLASRLEARSKLLQLSLVSLFISVQSSRSSDQCVVLVITHKY
jgi:hypothetical protein